MHRNGRGLAAALRCLAVASFSAGSQPKIKAFTHANIDELILQTNACMYINTPEGLTRHERTCLLLYAPSKHYTGKNYMRQVSLMRRGHDTDHATRLAFDIYSRWPIARTFSLFETKAHQNQCTRPLVLTKNVSPFAVNPATHPVSSDIVLHLRVRYSRSSSLACQNHICDRTMALELRNNLVAHLTAHRKKTNEKRP